MSDTWRVGSNGAGRLRFFVCRGESHHTRFASDERGNYRRFASIRAAQAAADALNAAEAAA